MPDTTPILTLPRSPEAGRKRYAFLVSTTGCASQIRKHLGSAGYSYFFAYEALKPVLESLGTCKLVERPESRLPFLAEQARELGFEPIHLAINPPQDVYLTPAVTTIVYPFWEFPDVPSRDFGDDTRQNWARILRKADALAAPCGFTAEALDKLSLKAPIDVVPVPLRPEFFELPDWSPDWTWTYTGRHAIWTNEPEPEAPRALVTPEPKGRLSELFESIAPRLGPKNVQKIYQWKQRIVPAKGESFHQKQYRNLRLAYNRYVRRWLSDDAVSLVTRAKRKALRMVGMPEKVQILPGLPVGTLNLNGLVYTTIFNVGDKRKNYGEILSAFLLAFRDRADATLVIKLVTNPVREHDEVGILRKQYERLGIRHRCKVVVISDFLTDAEMSDLFRATTFYVNQSFGEGACLPLQQGLAGGRPALAPAHSAMTDYLSDRVAFVTSSSAEPIHWPHDPEERVETVRFRPQWADLHRHLIESAEIALNDRATYQEMADQARAAMAAYAGRDVVRQALEDLLTRLPYRQPGALDWAS